jgi:bifunctional UDP-N-acetylglucosamine pyrophosphorylase/glucosamine-1-phosphate N-acetyltransferase
MTQIIIMAAGKGTRMGSELPKVLVPLKGRPMLDYLLDSISKTAPALKPIVIVSPDNQKIIAAALQKYDVQYVVQEQQLGTGHAVACARDYIDARAVNIFVLNGDHPFYKSETIQNFPLKHEGMVSMITLVLPNFADWRSVFYHWGRIIRGKDNNVQGIKEFKDATDEEKEILEVNPNCFCFNKDWFFANIDKVHDDNKAHEFYLTDMVKIAFASGHHVGIWNIEPKEAMGINSPEELQIAESLVDA